MECTDLAGFDALTADPIIAQQEPSTGPIILLVEDEDFVRQVTCQVLQSAGFRVLQAREAIEATVAFRQHRSDVHLLITDVVMPGQNGQDLARELRSVSGGLSVLFVSGYPENAVTRNAEQEHAVFYLPKPYSAKALVQAVHDILEECEGNATRAKRAAGTL